MPETIKGTLTRVIQSLERIERMEEGITRTDSIPRSAAGDANHQDIPTNLAALNAKLGCLQGILGTYQTHRWRDECVKRLYQWYQKRPGRSSLTLTQATLDCVSACMGLYEMKEMPDDLDESQCADFLSEICNRYLGREGASSSASSRRESRELLPIELRMNEDLPILPQGDSPRSWRHDPGRYRNPVSYRLPALPEDPSA